jgi:hypothetical protein
MYDNACSAVLKMLLAVKEDLNPRYRVSPVDAMTSPSLQNTSIVLCSGLPDGLFKKTSKFGYTLLAFGIFCVHLVYFIPFWYVVPRKIWPPWQCYVIVNNVSP